MHDAHAFLRALTIVLGVAAVTTVLFQLLRQPVVLGYLLAGLIIASAAAVAYTAPNPSESGPSLSDSTTTTTTSTTPTNAPRPPGHMGGY